ncbi:uncharacterized protein LOC130768377 isoform X7 [Actinidia eriantha]|uniref:uncharacterized protein LOC130768377 isoform X7 n=1 Tax=Actinidia eriantha TaxID=165200 RepID=UPI0025839920|nr:uncharacterized protein LOC130768377 isoform X7 [Actinidia eriantha]
MMRNGEHSLNGTIPAEIAENLKEIFPEFGDLNYEEVLQHQESVYQSLKGNNDSNKERRSSSGQSSDSSQFSGQEREPSRQESFDSQLALDEAVARSLQELEDNFDDLNISQSSKNTEFSSRETPSTSINQTPRGDDVDPDNMTYEVCDLLHEIQTWGQIDFFALCTPISFKMYYTLVAAQECKLHLPFMIIDILITIPLYQPLCNYS